MIPEWCRMFQASNYKKEAPMEGLSSTSGVNEGLQTSCQIAEAER